MNEKEMTNEQKDAQREEMLDNLVEVTTSSFADLSFEEIEEKASEASYALYVELFGEEATAENVARHTSLVVNLAKIAAYADGKLVDEERQLITSAAAPIFDILRNDSDASISVSEKLDELIGNDDDVEEAKEQIQKLSTLNLLFNSDASFAMLLLVCCFIACDGEIAESEKKTVKEVFKTTLMLLHISILDALQSREEE